MEVQRLTSHLMISTPSASTAEGEAKGKFTTSMTWLKNLMHNNHYSVDEAMTALGIITEDRQHYKDLLAKGM